MLTALRPLFALALLASPALSQAELLAGIGTGSPQHPGGLARLDGATFSGTLLSDSVAVGGLTGLTATPDGRLWGTVQISFLTGATLVELDSATGKVLSVKPLLWAGSPVRIADLATQPATGEVYAIGFLSPMGLLFKLDVDTGDVALVGDTGTGFGGGLAFAADGTLYLTSQFASAPTLVTLDPATGAVLSSIAYGPETHLDGLAVRPSDGALLATRGGSGFGFTAGDQVVEIDPVTGATTALGGSGVGSPSDLAFLPCAPVVATETVRLGSPPNPNVFLPGLTVGPVAGAVWDPIVDHSTFLPGALLDVAVLSPTPVNAQLPIGTLLCAPPFFGTQTAQPGAAFAVAVPGGCLSVGVPLCVQAGSVTAAGELQLTNALDIVIGFF
ncbi:MAG: hypothetical protein AAF682_11655 [Planctomycetota bacterium]